MSTFVQHIYEPFIPLTEVISFNAELSSSTANTQTTLASQFDPITLLRLTSILNAEKAPSTANHFTFEGHLFEFSTRMLESLGNVNAKRRLQALKLQNHTRSYARQGSIIVTAPEVELDQFDVDDDYEEIHPIDNHIRFAPPSPSKDPSAADEAPNHKKPHIPKKVGSGYLAKRRHDPNDFQLMPKNQEKSCLVWFNVACFDERKPKAV